MKHINTKQFFIDTFFKNFKILGVDNLMYKLI